jgi:hypothetical protein
VKNKIGPVRLCGMPLGRATAHRLLCGGRNPEDDVEQLEAFSAAWRVTVFAISLLAAAHLLRSIENIDSEALGRMLLGLAIGGGA